VITCPNKPTLNRRKHNRKQQQALYLPADEDIRDISEKRRLKI
jgi:hypothetical protein